MHTKFLKPRPVSFIIIKISIIKTIIVFTMPRVKSQDPESLKKLCVEFVASNLDRIHLCNPSSEDEINNKCDQEATLSQFDKLRKLST
jgi:hypothetical protein